MIGQRQMETWEKDNRPEKVIGKVEMGEVGGGASGCAAFHWGRRRLGLFSGQSDSLSGLSEVSPEISRLDAGGQRLGQPGLDTCQAADIPQTRQEWEVTPAAASLRSAPRS